MQSTKERNGIKISSPLVKVRTNKHKRRRTTDYQINVRGTIASFHIGTGGMDIGKEPLLGTLRRYVKVS